MIQLRTFGNVELTAGEDGDVDALIAQPKRLALLCYLAVPKPGTMFRRDTLLGVFWPEGDSEHTRMALRQALSHIRKALGHDAVKRRGPDEVGLNPDLFWCDVAAYEQALDACKWSDAIELYRGELLKGIFISNVPEFKRWLDTERTRLAARYATALEELAEAATAAGNTSAAVEWWQSLVRHDRYDSRYAMGLMEALERAGHPAHALLHAQEHTELLQGELDVSPPAEFAALIRRMREDSAVATGQVDRLQKMTQGGATVDGAQTTVGAVSKHRWRAPLVGAAALVVLVAVVVAALLSRGSGATLDSNHVVVAVLRNETGDPSLDPLGRQAGHAITQGLQGSGVVRFTPWEMALQSSDRVQTRAEAGRVRDRLRALAEETGAGTVISGAYYLEGENIRFHVDVTDATDGIRIGSPEAVIGPRQTPSETIGRLQQQVIGFLAVTFDERLAASANLIGSLPTYEAYRAFDQGMDAYIRSDYHGALRTSTVRSNSTPRSSRH